MENIREIIKKAVRRRKLKRVLALLSAIVVFVTTNRLILPVDALQRGVPGGAIYEDDLMLGDTAASVGEEASSDGLVEADELSLSDDISLAEDLVTPDQEAGNGLEIDLPDLDLQGLALNSAAQEDLPEQEAGQASSDNLDDFIDDAQLMEVDTPSGWSVVPGETYTLRLHFSEQENLEFDRQELFYALPETVVAMTDAVQTGNVYGECAIEDGKNLTVLCVFEEDERDFYVDIPVVFEKEGWLVFGNGVSREVMFAQPEAAAQPEAEEIMPEEAEQPAADIIVPEEMAQSEAEDIVPEKAEQPAEEEEQSTAKEIAPEEAEQPAEEVQQPAEEAEQSEAEEIVPEKAEQPAEEAEQSTAKEITPEEAEQPAEEVQQPAEEAEQSEAEEIVPEKAEQPAEEIEQPVEEAEQPVDTDRSDVVPTYVFGEAKAVLLSDILDAVGLDFGDAELGATVDDPDLVDIEELNNQRDYAVFARGYFDAVKLTLTTAEAETVVMLSNPQPGNVKLAGDVMASEDGRVSVEFATNVTLPDGTALTAQAIDAPELEAEAQAALDAGLAEALNAPVGQVQWFDIALGDVHEVSVAVTLRCEVAEGDVVAVAHLTGDGAFEILDGAETGDGFVTFDTESLSPFGVATPGRAKVMKAIKIRADDGSWDLDDDGVLTIHPNAQMNYTSVTYAPWYSKIDRDDVKRIVIEDGVKQIPSYFLGSNTGSTVYYKNLTSVSIPDSVNSIGSYAFRYCVGLDSITIPESVTKIDSYAFAYCTGLNTLTVPGSVTTINQYAFGYCSGLKTVNMPGGNGTVTMGTRVFRGCTQLVSATLPEGLATVSNNTFQGCAKLESVTIPSTVKTIGSTNVFSNCTSLKEVIFDDGNRMTSLPASLFTNKKNLERVVLPKDLTSIPSSLFSNCSALKDVNLGELDLVTSIGSSAFSGCSKLTSVVLPKYLDTIDTNAFQSTGLTSVSLPDGLKTIGTGAFQNSKLTNITLPETVTSLGSSAFYNCLTLEYADLSAATALTALPTSAFSTCKALETVKLPESMTLLGDSAFQNCIKLGSIDLPDGLTTIGNDTFNGCNSLSVVDGGDTGVLTLPETVTSIGSDAFKNCDQFTEITVPATSATSLGNYAFAGCDHLEKVTLGEGITVLPQHLFENDVALTSVTLKGPVTEIPDHAFYGCKKLKTFDMAEGTVRIGQYAFSECDALTKLAFPGSVTTIDKYAYSGCDRLATVTLPENLETIYEGVFKTCVSLKEINFNEGLTTIGKDAFNGCTALTALKDLPSTLTTIGESAFYRCTGLASATLDDNLKTIEKNAFNGCTALKRVEFNEGLETIKEGAFNGCGQLASVDFKDGLATIEKDAFLGCTAMTDAHFPGTLSSIGDTAFKNDNALANITFESGSEPLEIGKYAFYNDYNSGSTTARHVSFPTNLTTIGNYAFGGESSTKRQTFETVGFPDGCQFETIGTGAFRYNTFLHSVDLPDGVKVIGSDAFLGCTSLAALDLPQDGPTTIGDNAFKDCEGLTTLTIPGSVTGIGNDVFTGCNRLDNLTWDAPTTTEIGGFSTGTNFTLTLGPNAGGITETTLKTMIDAGATDIKFTPNSAITLPDMSKATKTVRVNDTTTREDAILPRPIRDLPAGDYYVDGQDVLYKIEENGEATLVYVPDGVVSYTLPASVNGHAVTGVRNNALCAARALEMLDFENAGQLANIESYAFANAPKLANVAGETTVAGAEAKLTGADVTGKDVFYRTALTDAALPVNTDNALLYGTLDNPEDPNWGNYSGVSVGEDGKSCRTTWDDDARFSFDADTVKRDPATGIFMFYTGETAQTMIAISNSNSGEIETGEVIRIYVQMDDGCVLVNEKIGDELPVEARNANDELVETDATVKVCKTDVDGQVYFEFVRPTQGITYIYTIENSFPSPTSAGGQFVTWAEYFDANDAPATEGKSRPVPEKHNTVDFCTRQDTYPVTKTAGTMTTPSVLAAEDGQAYINSHTYTINMKKSGATLDTVGRDDMTHADFEDVITLDDGIEISPAIIDEINNGKLVYKNAGAYKYIESPSCGTIFTFYTKTNFAEYLAPELSLKEGRLCLKWTETNNIPLVEDIRALSSIKVTVSDRVLRLSDQAVADKQYTIKNEVSCDQYFLYGPPKHETGEAKYTVNSGHSALTFTKAAKGGVRGSYAPYTLTLKSTGLMPITKTEMGKITDEINGSQKKYYIATADIWKMFHDETGSEFTDDQPLSEVLTLKITGAHLYDKGEGNPGEKTVTLANGGEGRTSYLYSGYDTAYTVGGHGERHERTTNATFEFKKTAGGISYTLSVPGEDDITGELTSEQALAEMFSGQGFIVTPSTGYYVEWDISDLDTFVFGRGKSMDLVIPTTLKDSFMSTDTDSEDRVYISTKKLSNTAKTSYNNLSATSAGVTHSQDATISKSWSYEVKREYKDRFTELYGDGAETAETDKIYVPEVARYKVTASHSGSAQYDVMPLTDHMRGRQTLLVPVAKNSEKAWAASLQKYTVNGTEYYLLGEGEYKNVYTGDAWADRVVVKSVAGDAKALDTMIYWYLDDYKGACTESIQYLAKVELNDRVEDGAIYTLDNASWLSDHQGHRIYDCIRDTYPKYLGVPLVTSFDKRIVERVGDHAPGTDYSNITKGKTVVYRLSLINTYDPRNFVVNGLQIMDKLPMACEGFEWTKDNVSIAYVGFEPGEDGDAWYIKRENATSRQYWIEWPETFNMTCTDSRGYGYIYVTLNFPDNTEEDQTWDA